MGPQPTENPFAALGLPPTWAPGPVSWQFGHLDAMTPNGVERIRVVMFDTPVGRVALAFPGESLRAFATQCIEQGSGLTIAGPAAVPPTNGARP